MHIFLSLQKFLIADKVEAVVKEQDLIRDIENNLEEWAKLKNQLESVKKGNLQTSLNKLGEERALLKKRQTEIEQELKTIKSTLVTVESEINKLEKEKNQQLKALEEERVKLLARAKKKAEKRTIYIYTTQKLNS